jgi:hypothetical protein
LGKRSNGYERSTNSAKNLEWCSKNPAKLIKKPLVKSAPVIPFTADEFKAIIEAVNQYLSSWCAFLFGVACRASPPLVHS